MKLFLTLFVFHCRTALRQPAGMLQAPFLMLMGALLFPLSGTPQHIAPLAENITWVLLLLSGLLAQPYLMDKDAEDGTLEQMRLAPFGLTVQVAAMLGAFWLCYFLPLVVMMPLTALWLGAEEVGVIPALMATLYMALLAFLTSALTLGTPKSPVLRAILVLPLYAPIMILGAGGASVLLAGIICIMLPLALGLGILALRSPAGS